MNLTYFLIETERKRRFLGSINLRMLQSARQQAFRDRNPWHLTQTT
jgi:hypothetical protein